MKTKLLTIATMLITLVAFSQKKSRGDRFFENGDYLNAIEQYAKQLNNGEYNKHILENISTSYYNTFQFRRAYRSLNRLALGKFKESDKSYNNEFNFKMYQVLSALGEYDKALPFLEKYKANNEEVLVNADVSIATIETFKLKDDDFTIKSIKGVNSSAAEFGAVKRGNILYFTSDRKSDGLLDKNYRWTHKPFLNLYKVEVDSENTLKSEPSPFNEKVNSNLHEGNFCFTKDGSTMYLSRSNKDKGRKKFDSIRKNPIHLYKSVLDTANAWSAPKKLEFNNVNYTIEHPALNSNEDKLYFSSNMPGGYGDYDLYYVDVNNDGTYGKPINLGETVNTANREQFPYVSSEGNLFFSSNGHLGLGMMDVFVAKYENNEYLPPVNLGAPINSSYDDFSFNYASKGNGFFASNRNKKSDEIYSFEQIGEIFLRPYEARFEVRDLNTKKYIPNATVSLIDSEGNVIYDNKLDSISAFNIDIMPMRYNFKALSDTHKEKVKPVLVREKKDQTYVIYLQEDKNKIQDNNTLVSLPITDNTLITSANSSNPTIKKSSPNQISNFSRPTLGVNNFPNEEEIKKQLLNDKEGPRVVSKGGKLYFEVAPIFFDYDKWNIRSDSKKVLDEFALKLERYKTLHIKIISHTDSRGTEAYNQLLSERRAESTRNYLALVGYVNARRMEFIGLGESSPLVGCENKVCTEEEHQSNRRSDFEIIKF